MGFLRCLFLFPVCDSSGKLQCAYSFPEIQMTRSSRDFETTNKRNIFDEVVFWNSGC